MHLYKQLSGPTVVRKSIPIVLEGVEHLLVLKGSDLLQIFRLALVTVEQALEDDSNALAADADDTIAGTDSFIGGEMTLMQSKENTSYKFVLVNEYYLDGYVTDFHAVSINGYSSNTDSCLAISFKHAKLVIMKWTPKELRFSPLSIHFYEKDLQTMHFFDKDFEAYFSVDATSSCLCLVYQPNMVALLPFRNDEMFEDNSTAKTSSSKSTFLPSVLLSSDQLDESISHIISLKFLPEYTQPTLAIIFQPSLTWTGLMPIHKNTVRYLVLSMDVAAKSSVVITSVTGLPHDLDQLVPLPAPLNGSLLIGANHMFHVDSSGNTSGVAVNVFSKKMVPEDFKISDQSDLNLRLEGCRVVTMDANRGEVLLILEEGSLYLVKFQLEGRRILGLKLQPLSEGDIFAPRPLTVTKIGSRLIFVGSNSDDAKILKWSYEGEVESDIIEDNVVESTAAGSISKKKMAVSKTVDDDDELDAIYGEDIYDETSQNDRKSNKKQTKKGSNDNLDAGILFTIHDILPNYGPISKLVMGWPNPYKATSNLSFEDPVDNCCDIVAATGADISGALCVFNRSIRPTLISDFLFEGVIKLWTLAPQSQLVGESDIDPYDTFLLASTASSSILYKMDDGAFNDVTMDYDATSEGQTIVAGTLLNGAMIVQVHEAGITYFDSDFQKIKEIELDYTVSFAQICDPYLVLHFVNDGSYLLYSAHINAKTGKPVLEKSKSIPDTPKTAHSVALTLTNIVRSSTPAVKKGVKRKRTSKKDEEEDEQLSKEDEEKKPEPVLLLSDDSGLKMINLQDTKQRLFLEGINKLPFCFTESVTSTVKTKSASSTKASKDSKAAKAAESEAAAASLNGAAASGFVPLEFSKISLFMLGDGIAKSQYLGLLSKKNDFILYNVRIVGEQVCFVKSLSQPASSLVKANELDSIQLIPFTDINDYSGLVITGSYPLMLMKTSQSPPRLHRLTNQPVYGFTQFNTELVYKGFAYTTDESITRIANLDTEFDYGNLLPAKQIKIGSTITGMCYHEASNTYAVSTAKVVPYKAVDEDGVPIPGVLSIPPEDTEEQPDEDTKESTPEPVPAANNFIGEVKLISPMVWAPIDTIELEENEVVLDIKSLVLEMDTSKTKKEVIAFATSYLRGEDLASKGNYYIYNVIDVVPEPGRPETNHRLKEIIKEAVKTATSKVGSVNGYLMVAQGQKIVVRSLAEDNSVIPVAFIDFNIFVVDCKSVKNFVLLSDALKSVWLVGFGEEPYRMTLVGKDYQNLETTSAEFIVHDGKLFITVADRDQKLHILQYDPEDPQSLQGQRLVRRSEFFTGKISRSMVLAEETAAVADNMEEHPKLVPIIGSDDGSLSCVLPLSEQGYRTLFAIQQQIIEKDEHNACLNPRMHRMTDQLVTGQVQAARKPLLDYHVIARFNTLSAEKQYMYSRRLGKNGLQEVHQCLSGVEKSLDYI